MIQGQETQMKLDGAVVLVTGGAHGIGRAMCRAFHAAGARVGVADLDHDAAGRVAAEIQGLALCMDVTQPRDIEAGIERLEQEFGPVTVFVSNAGVAFGDDSGSAVGAPLESWDACLQVNLMAHVHAARLMVPRLLAAGGGCLVNVASAAGLLCQIGDTPYTASKHAAVGFAKSLAIAHGEQGIQVHLLCPQAVATRMIGVDEDAGVQPGETGFGGNDADGILSPERVADCVIDAIAQKRFLVLPHEMTATHLQRMSGDPDRWIKGMQRLRASLEGDM